MRVLVFLMCWLLVTQSSLAGGLKSSQIPQKKELFANQSWYKSQAGKETSFTGTLTRVKGNGGIGFGRFNPYRLEMESQGKKTVREVYVGGKVNLLSPYLGKRIRLIGKAVDIQVEGQFHPEIWPARLEVVAKAPPQKGQDQKKGKILGKVSWRYVSRSPSGSRQGKQFVIRSSKELQKHVGKNSIAQVQKQLAKSFKVKELDWEKHMLVVVTAGVRPTGGYRIEVTSLKVKKDALVVAWKVTPPRGIVTQAFTHPAIAVLVDRFDGPVQFQSQRGQPFKKFPFKKFPKKKKGQFILPSPN